MAVIAVDLLSTRVTCAAISKSGLVLEKETIEINGISGKEVSLLIQQRMKEIIQNFLTKPIQITSAGIGVPGIYFSKTGEVWAPNIPGWQNYNLKRDMNKFFTDHKILVKIASKRTCDILGEKWLGAAKKHRNAIFLSIGNGIGAGILIDGKILHGFNDGAGASGWMALKNTFCDEFKKHGCFEYLASIKGVKNLISRSIEKKDKYKGILNKQDITVQEIFTAYELKDSVARDVVNIAVEYWSIAAANLINLFNPEILIWGGALFGPAIKLIPQIQKEAEKWCHPLFFNQVRFVPSQLGENAGLYGAGHLALKKI